MMTATQAKIEKGRALVLAGPQGCGKTTLARKLAEAAGSYRELQVRELESPRDFRSVLESAPTTCIVDGLPTNTEMRQLLKALITNTETVLHRKHQESQHVRSPNFIFCTHDPEALKHLEGRRYNIVHLTTQSLSGQVPA